MIYIRHKCVLVCGILLVAILVGCRGDYSPKPDAFFRIDMPPALYDTAMIDGFPLSFAISRAAQVNGDSVHLAERWFNIVYPAHGLTLYCSLIGITPQSLTQVMQDSRALVYRHSVKVDAIDAVAFDAPERKIFATLFLLYGGSATPLQFVVTDSAKHLLRGALYFDHSTNPDSIAPVVAFVTRDVERLIESITWR